MHVQNTLTSRATARPRAPVCARLRPLIGSLAGAALLALGALSPAVQAAEQARSARANPAAPETRILVRLKADSRLVRTQVLSATATARDELAQRAAGLGARHGMSLDAGPGVDRLTQSIRVRGTDLQTALKRLRADAEVAWAVPDGRVQIRATRTPNDPLFATGPASGRGPAVGQWYLQAPDSEFVSAVNAPTAWGSTTGRRSFVVAVVDTGVLRSHPDLSGQLLGGYDFVSDEPTANDGDGRDADPTDPGDWITAADARTTDFSGCDVSDSSWHGTQVASIVGAATNNSAGMAGLGWATRVVPVRALGKCGGFDSDVIAAMRWAAGLAVPGVPDNANPARVVNLSLGSSGECTAAYADAIAEINAAGAVVVVAAGNSAGKAVNSPANCAGAIGVAGLRHVGSKVGFSDLGPEIALSAPGGNCVNENGACLYPILTALNSGTRTVASSGYTYSDSFNYAVGTSFSAPLVSATAALVLARQPGLAPADVREVLVESARAFPTGLFDSDNQALPTCQAPTSREQLECVCTTRTCGAGMLDAGAAVGLAGGVFARIEVQTDSPQAGETLTVSAADSLLGAGRSIASVAWTLLDGGGAVTGFAGATNALTTTLQPVGAGTVKVSVRLVDNTGQASSATAEIDVAAAADGGGTSSGGGGSGGGGAFDPIWLAALACAVMALAAALRRNRLTARTRRCGDSPARPREY